MSNKQFNRNSGNGDKKKKDDFWSDFPVPSSTGSPNTNASQAGEAPKQAVADKKMDPPKAAFVPASSKPPVKAAPAPVPVHRSSTSSWHSASRPEPSSSKKQQNAAPKQAGVAFPMIVLIAVIAFVTFVLPKMEIFSDVVDISASDVDSYVVQSDAYIAFGDEGAHVTGLQRHLYALGYLSADDITGKYDSVTDKAVSQCCSENSLTVESDFCSRDKYDAIMGIEEKVTTPPADVTTTPTETTTSTETTTTTTTTAPADVVYYVRVIEGTKLRDTAHPKATPHFFLNPGEEYKYIEEKIGSDGELWYKLRYSDKRTGWVHAYDVEKIIKD